MAEADGSEEVHTCERCGKVRPAGWTCACGGEGQAAPVPPALAERDPATTTSPRPRLSLVRRPEPSDGGAGGLKSEAGAGEADGHLEPSGSPPVDQGSE